MEFKGVNSLNKIAFQGTGQFLKMIDLATLSIPDFISDALSPPPTADASLSAYLDLTYNFGEPSFHGNLNVFLNVANGQLSGAGAGGKMVDAEIHFDPTKWYIYIGRPFKGQRVGILFDVPLLSNTRLRVLR